MTLENLHALDVYGLTEIERESLLYVWNDASPSTNRALISGMRKVVLWNAQADEVARKRIDELLADNGRLHNDNVARSNATVEARTTLHLVEGELRTAQDSAKAIEGVLRDAVRVLESVEADAEGPHARITDVLTTLRMCLGQE